MPSLPNFMVWLAKEVAESELVRDPPGRSRAAMGMLVSGVRALRAWLIAPKTATKTITTMIIGISRTNQMALDAVAATCGPIVISIWGITIGSVCMGMGTASWL